MKSIWNGIWIINELDFISFSILILFITLPFEKLVNLPKILMKFISFEIKR